MPTHSTRVVTIESPPQRIDRVHHEYVRIPTVDRRAEALEEALAREARTLPRHAPIVERIRKTAEALAHGEAVHDKSAPPTGHGLGWSDPP